MSAWDCPHPETEVRGMRIHGGGIQYRHQCLTCGRSASNPIGHALVSDFVEWDVALQERFEESARAESAALRAGLAELVQQRNEHWRAAYGRYLASPEWRRKREAVLGRDGGRCQGCLMRPAQEVHHLSYAHVGREFAFELVALCGVCHDRFHADGAAPEFSCDA